MAKTYPTIVVLVQQTHELTGLQAKLILKSRVEVQLHTVDGGLSRATRSGNGSGAGRWSQGLAGSHHVHAVLSSRRARRHGIEVRHRLGEIESLRGVVFANGGLAGKGNSRRGSSSSSAGSDSCGNHRFIIGVRWAVRRAGSSGRVLAFHGADGHGRERRLLGDALGVSKRIGRAAGTTVCGRAHLALPRTSAGRAARLLAHGNGGSSARSSVGVLLGLAGLAAGVQIGKELRDRAQAESRRIAGWARRRDGGGVGEGAVELLVVFQLALLLLALHDEEVESEEDDQDGSENTNHDPCLCANIAAARAAIRRGRGRGGGGRGDGRKRGERRGGAGGGNGKGVAQALRSRRG